MNYEEYANILKNNLQGYTDELIQNLKCVFQKEFFSEVELLDFSVFDRDVDFSIQMYSMNRKAAEVFNLDHKENDAFAGSLSLITDIPFIPKMMREVRHAFYEQDDIEMEDRERHIISEWFFDCWKKAGGDYFKIPSYFYYHDDFKAFDLLEVKWILDHERWEPLDA